MITETWLYSDQDAKMKAITPEGYDIFSNSRDSRKGGGVAIVCRRELRCRIIDSSNKFTSFEYFQLDISANNKTMSLFPIYRPEPNMVSMDTFFSEFSSYLEMISILSHEILILGDFNVHMDMKDNPNSRKFMDIVSGFNLVQHVMESSHESGHILDLVISRRNDFVSNVIAGEYFSDHKVISFNIKLRRLISERKIVTSRNYKNMDTNSFLRDINARLLNVQSPSTIDEFENLVDSYDTIMSDLIEKYAPLKTRTINLRPKAPWMDMNIIKEKKIKRKYERKWRSSKLYVDKLIYKDQKKKYDKLLNTSHRKYLSNLVLDNQNDPKTLFKLINSLLTNNKKNLLPEHTSEKQLAEEFSEYFLEKVAVIYKNLRDITSSHDCPVTPEQPRYQTTLDAFTEVTDDNISILIGKTPKKSCVLDPLPTWLLADCKEAVLPIIRNIINSSITLSHLPNSLKFAVLTPILKKLNLSLILKNFRPVSNLKYISKLIERVINMQLQEHLYANNILEPMQSAYRRGHSTETALLKVQDDILRAMDNKKVTVLLLLDLSAAFDTVCHTKLIKRLRDRIGITGKALDWFVSYLNDRRQCVSVNKEKSDPRNLIQGVPQGSVLGPILFSLYTLPLADILKVHGVDYHLYADDTQIYMSFQPDNSCENEIFETLSTCICDVKKWMAENLLQLNTDKTQLLFFGTNQQLSKVDHATFDAAGDIVDVAYHAKNLGVLLDSGLNMKDHITDVSKKSFYHLRNISSIRKYLTLDAAKAVIQALVCSRLDINNSLYYGLPGTQIQRLQRIQNAAARLILQWKKFDHISPGLRKLHWLPVHYRIRFKLLVLTYKCLNKQAPSYLSDLLQPKTCSSFELRSKNNPYLLETPRSRLVFGGDRSFSVSSPKEWNTLPLNIQSSESISIFKQKLKTYFFKECYNM